MTVTYFSAQKVLGPSRIAEKTILIPCAQRIFAPVLCRFPRLHGSGTGIPGIGILIYSWYWSGIGISSGDGHLLKKSRCLDVSLTSSRHRWLKLRSTVIKHCGERSSVGTLWSRENNGIVGVETAPRGHESRKSRAVRTWQRLWRLGFSHSTDTRVPLDPAYLENSETVANRWWWRLHHTNSNLRLYCTYSRCSHRREHGKWWGKLDTTVSKLGHTTMPDVRNVRSGRQYGTIRANYDIQVRFQDWRRGRPSERISGTGETIRWGERYRSRSRSSEKACIVSNTPEPLKTHLQLNVEGLLEEQTHLQDDFTRWRFNGSRCSSPGKGKAKKNPAKGKKGGKKGKEIHSGNDNRTLTIRWRMSKLRKVWTQSIWLWVRADDQISR